MRHRKIIATLLSAAVALSVSASLATAPAADAHNGFPSRLDAGHSWTSHTNVESPNGEYLFDAGNLYISEVEGDLATDDWYLDVATGRCGRPTLTMQYDGNLVLYCRPGGRALWSSRTYHSGGANYLQLQDDGNLVVYTAAGHPVWASRSGQAFLCTGEQLLPGQQLRRSGDYGATFGTLTMRRTGNLTLDWLGRTYWSSNTHTPGSRMRLLGGGNLIVQGPYGRLIWSSHTAGRGPLTFLSVSGGDRRFGDGPHVWIHNENDEVKYWRRP